MSPQVVLIIYLCHFSGKFDLLCDEFGICEYKHHNMIFKLLKSVGDQLQWTS